MFNICYADESSVRFFLETGQLLACALEELGRSCTASIGFLREDRTNILLDYHRIRYDEGLKRFRYIPFQLEQLSENCGHFDANAAALLQNATCVWDYAEENARFLEGFGVRPVLVPLGHHARMRRIAEDAGKDVDVLFYGALNERRQEVLDAIRAAGLRLKVLCGVFGEERDGWIARSKIVVNIHYYPMMIMETVRLSYLLSNRAFILSENSPVNPLRNVGLPCMRREDLAAACLRFAADDALRDDIRRKNAAAFAARYDMARIINENYLQKAGTTP